jgi:hypothetical protein
MATPDMKRAVFDHSFELAAPPERIFPLLCPVREHEWIPTWRAEILYSRSGFAELDCVFKTDSPSDGARTWVCSHYEPCRTIGYTSFSTLGYVMRLDITLEPVRIDSTRVRWSRRFIAIDPAGSAWIDTQSPEAASNATLALAKLLGHYLATGAMLRL